MKIIVESLTYPDGNPEKHRKLAILAPRGSGKSWALSIAVVIYMFFKRFRDLVFVLAPTEDQCALIFNYVYRHFKDNTFLDSLVDNYKLHNKPHIKMKGGTILRRAPVAPSNQGQSIRGQHPTLLIVDESPLISDELFIDNVEPAIVANKAPFINLGTPKTKENHMYRYLFDEGYADTFTRLHFTWKDAVIKGEAYSPPYDEEDMLNKMLEWGEDSLHWKTEYECEFVESISNVFTPTGLRACFDDYELLTPETIGETGKGDTNNTVAVDIGKSVNSTVISVWRTEKGPDNNFARLLYLEEIGPKSGGHDIPYQRERIMDVAVAFSAARVIIDATGIGGAIEQEIRMACIPLSIHFIPFVFTGGAKGSKTYAYRDFVSFVQQGLIKVPDVERQEGNAKKLMWKWYREHVDLEYVMDNTQKTEKIMAPSGKHDDYCDSSVLGIHAALSMLPADSMLGTVNVRKRGTKKPIGRYGGGGITTSGRRRPAIKKRYMRGL
tara:strand:- start:680 stop:2164 length:1485 start_codon:yes stop_codon:yes gene_type:complete